MSRTIEIKDLPDAFVERLERRAARQGTTLHAMIIEELEELAPPGAITLGEWVEQERDLRARGLTRREIVETIHAGRRERDEQIEAAWSASRRAVG